MSHIIYLWVPDPLPQPHWLAVFKGAAGVTPGRPGLVDLGFGRVDLGFGILDLVFWIWMLDLRRKVFFVVLIWILAGSTWLG